MPWRTYSNSRRSTLPGAERQAGVLALQRLHAGQLVGADDPLPRAPPAPGPPRYSPHTSADLRRRASGVGRRGQPVADAVRLERPLLSSRPAWRGEMAGHDAALDRLVGDLAPGPLADRAARRRRGLAGQRDDPADLLGGDAARARRGGARPPAAPPRSGRPAATAARPSQRPRHRRAGLDVHAHLPGDLRRCCGPPPAARTMRARSAHLLRASVRRRTSASRPRRSASVRATAGGFGPRMLPPASTPLPRERPGPTLYHGPTSARVY